MNKIEEIIKSRRSISQYEDRAVDRKLEDYLLEGASYTPSSCNTQPWYFLIFDSVESRNKLRGYIDEGYEETKKVLKKDHRILGQAYVKILEFFSIYGKFDNAPVEMLLFAKPYDAPILAPALKLSGNKEIDGVARDSVKTSGAMAMQNLLLMAHENGLGTRVKDGVKFMMDFPELRQRFYNEFSIPPEYVLISGIQLGYPTSKALERKAHERKPLNEMRRYV